MLPRVFRQTHYLGGQGGLPEGAGPTNRSFGARGDRIVGGEKFVSSIMMKRA